MHLTSEHAVRRLSQSDPVVYMIFDLLWLEGHSLMELPYEERRAKLVELGLSGPTWQTPAHHVGDGAGLLEASRAQGLEGIIAKRLDCPYTPGRRSQGWVKVKNIRRADAVIGGWLPGEGGPLGPPRRARGRLLRGRRAALRRAASAAGSPRRSSTRARHAPRRRSRARTARSRAASRRRRRASSSRSSSCVVDYSEVTNAKTLRQPSYKGLRDDIAPEDVGPPDEV